MSVKKTGKIAVLVAMAGLLMVGLAGCFAALFPSAQATLTFSPLVGTVGGPGEVTVSVAAMPGDGLGALAVGAGGPGFRYDPTQFQVTGVVGRNGFVVLSVCINNTTGEVRFVAVSPVGGLKSGDVAAIIGNRLGGGPSGFAVAKEKVQLGDAHNEMIGDYTLAVGQASPYFIKEER